jgi:tetratricopeptide (TPR) repeat protein
MELEIRRDTSAAIAAMDAALRDPVFVGMDSMDVPYLELADFYLGAGRPDRAEGLLEAFLTDVPFELRLPLDRWLYMIRGRTAMERGRLEEARQAFVIADTYQGSPFLTLQYLGPLDELAGRPDSAIVSYERYLSAGTTDRLVWDALLLPGVLERLGQLHEAAGHAREAAGYYTRFADLWAHADPELRPRAELARRRAEALTGGSGAM